MRRAGLRLRHLAALGVGLWVGRWALLEAAARVASWIPPRPRPPDPSRPPGRMPGPFDRP